MAKPLKVPENRGEGPDLYASSSFEIDDVPYDAHFDEPMETIPPPHYAAEDQDEGEFDPLISDFYVTRSIREAAQSTEGSQRSSTIDKAETSSGKSEQSRKISQPNGLEDNPLGYMEDIQPTALPEQRASTFMHDINQGVPDISDIPTDVYEAEVEDLGEIEREK